MSPIHRFLIKNTDRFDPEYFASLNEEITSINSKTASLPALFRVEIIVSCLKNQSLEPVWIDANPALTSLVKSGRLFTGSIESLFASCQNNPGYRHDLEEYLVKRFTTSQPPESQGEA